MSESPTFRRPSRQEVEAAGSLEVPDLIAPGLTILFCGINPSLYSAAVGHHFARPGNRFWPSLHAAGLTPRLYSPFEDEALLDRGIGVTNVVARASATAAELSREEIIEGGRILEAKVGRYRPKAVAFLGITTYRAAFQLPRARIGRQDRKIASSEVWALPNPSGLNAHYQVADLARLFADLHAEASAIAPG